MLAQQLSGVLAVLEFWHLLCEHGEDVLFFNAVVRGKVGHELETQGEEAFEGEIGWPFVG